MKLDEVIDVRPRQNRGLRRADVERKELRLGTLGKELGSGVYGRAYELDQPRRAGEVVKHYNAIDSKNDGYTWFLRIVQMLSSDGSNKFLPVIYHAKSRQEGDADSTLHGRVRMERLTPFMSDTIPEEIFKATFERLFSVPMMRPQQVQKQAQEIKKRRGINPYRNDDDDYYAPRIGGVHYQELNKVASKYQLKLFYAKQILGQLIHAIESGDVSNVNDADLKKVIILLHRILKAKPNLHTDLHTDNVMWRMTGTMPQLVIVDPLS